MRVLTVALAVLALAGAAQADMLIDFGEPALVNEMPNETYDPTPSPDPFLGKHWANADCDTADANAIRNFNLVDAATGAATGAVAGVSGFTTDSGYNPNPDPGDPHCRGVDAQVVYPRTAQRDIVGVPHDKVGIVTISGLTEPEYAIRIFGSLAANPAKSWYNDNSRRNNHTVGGVTMLLHCFENTSDTVTFYNVAPVNGEIVIETTGAPNPEGGSSYAYLGVVELIVPEPATLSLLALGGLVAIRRRR